LAAGLGAGILILGQAFTLAPFCIYLDLRFRSWLASDFLWALAVGSFCGLEYGGLWWVMFDPDNDLPHFDPALAAGLIALIGLGRLLLVNILLPEAIMAHCAAQFDRLTLRHLAKDS